MPSALPGEETPKETGVVKGFTCGMNASSSDCQHRFTQAENRLITPLTGVQECSVALHHHRKQSSHQFEERRSPEGVTAPLREDLGIYLSSPKFETEVFILNVLRMFRVIFWKYLSVKSARKSTFLKYKHAL